MLYLKELEKFQKKFKNTFVRSPLASGILSGNISINSKFPDDDHRSEWLIKERLSYIVSRVEEINAIKGNLTLPSISRKFLLQNKNIHKVIFGIKSIEHVKDIMDDLSSTNIDQNLIQKIFMLEKDRRGIKNDDKGF